MIFLLLLSVFLIIILTTRFKLHPFLALLLVGIGYGLATGMSLQTIVQSINEGFGGTLGKIGLVIVLGVIIGTFLENSGGAFTMAEKILKIIGKKRVPTAMGIIGYFVAIPVFADSGFIILSPLNKSLSKKAGISLAASVIALAMGLMVTHNLVPPTPGPIAAVGILGADLGLVMVWGIAVSMLAFVIGLIYAKKYAGKTYIDPNPELTEEEVETRLKDAPGAVKAFLPILVPIVLIVVKSLIEFKAGETALAAWQNLLVFLGEPVIALIIGMFLSFMLPKKLDKEMLSGSGWVGKALRDAAAIILITGAGGIFGKILQNSGIADLLSDRLANASLGLWLPFLLAAAIKTAQGSSTVALITTASIMAPLMQKLGFETETAKAMVVLSIGAGSAVFSHANDSFFWIVTQMTGMSVSMGYRLYSLGTFIVGTSAALILYVAYLFVQ
ncbi:MAG: GntP family permease [Cytophagales bacterium]|nr:GntP family permease [Cytophagales bacterium]